MDLTASEGNAPRSNRTPPPLFPFPLPLPPQKTRLSKTLPNNRVLTRYTTNYMVADSRATYSALTISGSSFSLKSSSSPPDDSPSSNNPTCLSCIASCRSSCTTPGPRPSSRPIMG